MGDRNWAGDTGRKKEIKRGIWEERGEGKIKKRQKEVKKIEEGKIKRQKEKKGRKKIKEKVK